MTTIVPVILAGGGGTRLWPLSRKLYPKQFLALGSDGESMLQKTLKRLAGFTPAGAELAPPLVVCNEEHRFLVAEHARAIDVALDTIVLEPEGRNTAPALTVAAELIVRKHPEATLVMMPADHLVTDVATFQQALADAIAAAALGHLTTFGIVPTAPETGYGYLNVGAAAVGEGSARELAGFVEKPDADTAAAYLASGNYLWNSGLFVMRAAQWLEAVAALAPAIADAGRSATDGLTEDGPFSRVDREAFLASPSDSIDYAVMEKLAEVPTLGTAAVVPLDAGWSDIGAWSSVWETSERDADGNACVGDARVFDGRNNLIHADDRLVAVVGLDDVVVVETKDAVLVTPRERAQDVRDVVAWLDGEQRSEPYLHRRVFRPWGSYEGVDEGERFQVKRIIVQPGQKLSLQMHHHRAEHWIVVRGTAQVTRGDETFMLGENESTFIPLGVTHRLENPGRIPLELIEVQSGAYLGEDDIVRFEDVYQR